MAQDTSPIIEMFNLNLNGELFVVWFLLCCLLDHLLGK